VERGEVDGEGSGGEVMRARASPIEERDGETSVAYLSRLEKKIEKLMRIRQQERR
jgi:hypothetical protein